MHNLEQYKVSCILHTGNGETGEGGMCRRLRLELGFSLDFYGRTRQLSGADADMLRIVLGFRVSRKFRFALADVLLAIRHWDYSIPRLSPSSMTHRITVRN